MYVNWNDLSVDIALLIIHYVHLVAYIFFIRKQHTRFK